MNIKVGVWSHFFPSCKEAYYVEGRNLKGVLQGALKAHLKSFPLSQSCLNLCIELEEAVKGAEGWRQFICFI